MVAVQLELSYRFPAIRLAAIVFSLFVTDFVRITVTLLSHSGASVSRCLYLTVSTLLYFCPSLHFTVFAVHCLCVSHCVGH